MRCRVNFQSDPISLTIIAGDGKEHGLLEEIGDGNFVEIAIHKGVDLTIQAPKQAPQSTITSNPIANHAPKMVVEGEEGTRYGK